MPTSLTPAILLNPHKSSISPSPWQPPPNVLSFHQQLPYYAVTPLASLPSTARSLNLRSVLVKDESLRLGLPAFKILGASWAVHRAICKALSLDPAAITSLADLKDRISKARTNEARRKELRLVTSTDGNWGRGVARMGMYLGVQVVVFVPRTMDEGTRGRIRGEGAEVWAVDGDYDLSVQAAEKEAGRSKDGAETEYEALLVQDVAWEGYEEVPGWVVEGYSTMMRELDEQLVEALGQGQGVDLVIASVGVGSFAQAVTMHFKGKGQDGNGGKQTKVLVVEPETAACLRRSLQEGKITSIETEDTIMCGMNCGTVSTTSWPVLREGVDAAVIVTDDEAHEALLEMSENGVAAGPCGAAPLAALKKVCEDGSFELGPNSNAVLFCTEGTRLYTMPAAAVD